jgi:hypothetical protein
MKPERELAVAAMQNMGWTAKQEKRGKTQFWVFSRPDTGGLWDVASVRQDILSMNWVAEKAMQYHDAPDLVQTIQAAKDVWLRARFFGIFRAAQMEAHNAEG